MSMIKYKLRQEQITLLKGGKRRLYLQCNKRIRPITMPVCQCKVKLCLICNRCSRCECAHDGQSIEDKISRKRGRYSGLDNNNNSHSPKKKRKVISPTRLLRPRIPVETQCLQQNGNMQPDDDVSKTSPTRVIKTLSDLFEAFQIEKSSALRKMLSAADTRSSITNWEGNSEANKKMKRSVANVYKFVMSHVAVLLCGPAAQVSISQTITQFNNLPQHVLTLPLIRTIVRLKKSKIETRTARAYLCGSTRRKDIGQLKSVDRDFTLSRKSFQQGLQDFNNLTDGQCLTPVTRSVQRYQRESLDLAITFILGSDNVSYTSWGTKSVLVDGFLRRFPLVMRKISRTNMYNNYTNNTNVIPKQRQLKRTSFFILASTLTHCEAKLRKAVDYVTGFLVNDSFAVILKLVGVFTQEGEGRRSLLREIECANRYLKYGFHSDNNIDCIAHRVPLALGCEDGPADATPKCINCRHIFYIFQHLKECITNSTVPQRSALEALDGCQQKTLLFMGHRLRVLNQQNAIKEMHIEMENDCLQNGVSNQCVILIDYKMKFEPVYYREKTVDHYGKRGISWHGSMITFYTAIAVDGVRSVVPNKFYIDHVVENENKQDVAAVISILEAVIIATKKLFPDLTTINLQSDNASCYQNTALLILIPYLAYAHSICIRRYIHTETQDGKSVLDAHFARSTQVVYDYCKAGNDVVTPSQLVTALKYYGGLENSIVELVKLDRDTFSKLEHSSAECQRKLKQVMKRTNDVFFLYGESVTRNEMSTLADNELAFQKMPSFSLQGLEYSGVGNPTTFVINPGSNTVTRNAFTSGDAVDNNESEEEPESDCDEVDDNRESSINLMTNEHSKDCVSSTDSEDSDYPASNTDEGATVSNVPQTTQIGKVTGIYIYNDVQLATRKKRWKKKCKSSNPSHVKNSAVKKKNLTNYALRKAWDLQLNGANQGDKAENTLEKSLASVPENYSVPHKFPKGWAKRPKNGHMYGPKHVLTYRPDILEMYNLGEKDKKNKRSAAQMLEMLSIKYPNEFCLPSENDIRVEINRLQTKKKNPDSTSKEDKGTDIYSAYIREIAFNNISLKPKDAVDMITNRFPRKEHPNLPSDSKIKGKFSYQKMCAKKRNDDIN